MIISASRRTDIPALYAEWLMNRLRAQTCVSVNPYNPNQRRILSLKPEEVDAIAFWTKNPKPLLPLLSEIDAMGHRYFFLFTLNDYPRELEPYLPPLNMRLDTFRKLADHVGPQRVIWRYDPIIISRLTNPFWHEDRFEKLCQTLSGYTNRVMTSLMTWYRKTDRNLLPLEAKFGFDRSAEERPEAATLLSSMVKTSASYGMTLYGCAMGNKFKSSGILPGRCIDPGFLKEQWGIDYVEQKDAGQRGDCNCAVSRDIGTPDSCTHGCLYCYATRSYAAGLKKNGTHSPASESLF